MKRLFFTLTVFCSLISFSSFAKGDEKVSAVVLEAFQASFDNATEVQWSTSENYYKANFNINGRYISAFYDADGKMIAMSRNITSFELPLMLQASLKKVSEDSWISDLFEMSNEEGTTYYVTLENAGTKTVLKASSLSSWESYQKSRKS